jgi:exonuclease SbcC
MRILELSLRNYRVFDEVDLELPARVIGIFGPNGAGKSTLVEAIAFALYGRARTDKKHIRTHGVLTDAAVRMVLEHGGQQYEVRRTIRGKNHQTEAELFLGDVQLATGVTEVDAEIQRLVRMDHKVFRASVFAEQKQLDAFSEVRPGERKDMVLRLLGIRPVDEARTAARKRARERKSQANDLSGALPDVREQEERLEAARIEEAEWRSRAETAVQALAAAEGRAGDADREFEESDRIRERIDQIAIERRGTERQAEQHGAHRDQLAARIDELEQALRDLPALEEERASLGDADGRLTAARRAGEVEDELRQVEAELAVLPQVDAAEALAVLRAVQAELDAARRAAVRAESSQERAREDELLAREALTRAEGADPAEPCPTCGRPLGDDFEEYVAHCRQAVEQRARAAAATVRDARNRATEVRQVEARHGEAVRAGEAARQATEGRSRLEAHLEKVRRRLGDLTEPFEGRVPDVQALAAEAARAAHVNRRLAELTVESRHLDRIRDDLATTTVEVDRCRTALDELAREEGRLGFDPEEHQRRAKEREEAGRLLQQARTEERMSADGLKDIAGRVKELRAEIGKVKEIASRAEELRVEARLLDRVAGLFEGFRTFLYGRIIPQVSRDAEALFRELTNHEYEDLRIDEETLAIQIADAGQFFAIERFSGSESDLANLALRVAISQHLSRMSGADVGMMILDEVMGALDAERKDLFVRAVGRLADRFHQLFVITHAEQVKDQFPASVEVRKTGRRRSQAILV